MSKAQPPSHPWRDEDKLRHLYCEKGLSQEEVGERLNCHQMTVSVWMDKLGIEARDPDPHTPFWWQDREFIEELYVHRGWSREKIVEELDIEMKTLKRFMAREQVAETEWEIENRDD